MSIVNEEHLSQEISQNPAEIGQIGRFLLSRLAMYNHFAVFHLHQYFQGDGIKDSGKTKEDSFQRGRLI